MWHQIWVNIVSGNGLLPDGTKPLPQPFLTQHHWGLSASTKGNFPEIILEIIDTYNKVFENCIFENTVMSPRG